MYLTLCTMTELPAPISEKDILTPPPANTPNTHNNTHTNSTKHQEVNVTISTPYRRDGRTKSTITSQKNNDTNDIQMVDTPYNFEEIREKILNNAIIQHLLRLNFVNNKISDLSIQRNFTVIFSPKSC